MAATDVPVKARVQAASHAPGLADVRAANDDSRDPKPISVNSAACYFLLPAAGSFANLHFGAHGADHAQHAQVGFEAPNNDVFIPGVGSAFYLPLSQSFSDSVQGGAANFGAEDLGKFVIPSAVPEPSMPALPGPGIASSASPHAVVAPRRPDARTASMRHRVEDARCQRAVFATEMVAAGQGHRARVLG